MDNKTLGDGNDSITADNTGTDVTSTADTIDGAGGTDTISIFSDGAAFALPKLSNIEIAYIYDQDADLNLSVASVADLEQVHLVRSDGAFGLTLGANATTAAVNDIVLTGAGGDAGITVTYGAAVTAGTLYVNGITTAGADADEDLNMAGTKLATANISAVTTKSSIDNVAVGAASAINLDAAVDFTVGALATTSTKATLTVSGAGKVTLGQIDDGITSIVATDNTGGLVLTAPANSKDAVYTLSSAADKVTTDDDGFATADKFAIDAGAGEDTLIIADDADVDTAGEGARYTNFEILQRAINANLDVSVFGTDTSIVKASIGDGGLTNMQAALAGAITVTADNAGSTFSLKTATGTSDTLDVTLNNATSTASADFATATVDGFETMNVTVNSGDALLSTGADLTAVSFTSAANLKTLDVNGSKAVNVDASSNATKLTSIDASDLVGGLQLSTAGQTGALVVTGSSAVDKITLGAVGAGGTVSVDAGAGKDIITTTIAIADAQAIDGGADSDTLALSDNITTTNTTTISDTLFNSLSNIEVIDFASATLTGKLVFTVGGFADRLATNNGGTLKITGDTFALTAAVDDIEIDASAMSAGNSISVDIKDTDAAVAGTVSSISVTGSDGDDVIKITQATAAGDNDISVTSGKGNDTITYVTGNAQDEAIVIDAGDGDDTIDVSAATTDKAVTSNLITGGKGNDTIKLDTEGAATDLTLIMGATAAANGVDTITNFTQGTGEDVLNIDAFLNATAMNAKVGANPGGASDVSGDVQLLVDISGGQDITTADGLTAALAAGGEFSNIDMGASQKTVFVTAANSDASEKQYIFYGTSDASGNVSVTLVGTVVGDIDTWHSDNFNI